MSRGTARTGRSLLALPAGLAVLLLGLPVAALLWRGLAGGGLAGADAGPIALALALSLATTAISLPIVLVLGAPLAWILARSTFPGKALVETLVDLPIVLPPSVAGLALLLAWGRNGVAGPVLEVAGVAIPFTTFAVVLAQVFVALPFFVRATRAGLAGVAAELEEAAAIDGAGPLAVARHVSLPVAAPAVAAGILLAWARALGEFGATMMFAGSLPGRTQTLPLLVYVELQGSTDAAIAAACVLVVAALVVLVAVRRTAWRAVL
ncbi:MAG: ABC transporter permease [Chloroflexota bacterium]